MKLTNGGKGWEGIPEGEVANEKETCDNMESQAGVPAPPLLGGLSKVQWGPSWSARGASPPFLGLSLCHLFSLPAASGWRQSYLGKGPSPQLLAR